MHKKVRLFFFLFVWIFLLFVFLNAVLQCEKQELLDCKRHVIQPCIFLAGMISDGKGQCGGSLCDSQEQSFRQCTCSCKTPKPRLRNPLISHIESPVNKCLVISLDCNIGLLTMSPGCSGTEQQQLKPTADSCKQEYSWRGKMSLPLQNLQQPLSPAEPWHWSEE